MTTQNHDTDIDQTELEQTDPVGPITLPRRSRVGARAMALVGAPAGIAAAGLAVAMAEAPGTWPTISVY